MTSTLPAITGPGLKKQGVVVLQIFFISLFTFAELTLRSGTGILTGLVIVVVTFGGIRFGRPGTRYVSVVTPPLVLGAIVTLYYLLADGLSLARLGIDIVAALASVGPWLLASALYGWFMFLNEKAKSRKPKPRQS
ncbi:MAG: hypothetical protein RIR99_82 [Actinomycetota bacterium]|jgi:hypothetical protein